MLSYDVLYLLYNTPIVVLFHIFTYYLSKDPIPWTSEEWTPEKEKPGVIKVPPYNMTPENVAEHKKEQNEWYLDGNSVGRFTGVYGTLYKVPFHIHYITFSHLYAS